MSIIATFDEQQLKLSSDVARNVELLRVRLVNLQFKVGEDRKKPKDQRVLSLKFSSCWSRIGAGDIARIDVTLKAVMHFCLVPEPYEGEVITFSVTAQLDYALPSHGRPDDETLGHLLQAFTEVNAPYTAWPYLREAIQSCIHKAGYSAPPLPVYRVEKRREGINLKNKSAEKRNRSKYRTG